MLPQKLKIAGYNYVVETDPILIRDRSRMGESCANALTITLDPTVPKQVQETALLHEILEQVNYHYELKLEHAQISVLETALYQVWQDNFK